tara:strand:- start:286 stop:684 length:399 start_codon:yes stop_codon:yes gene_type:complete
MKSLSWNQFDHAVNILTQLYQGSSLSGVFGIPRGGLCLGVALSHSLRLPLLLAPNSDCLIVDDVYETGKSLNAFRKQFPGASYAVWLSKQPTEWWQAAETTNSQEWLIFPWERIVCAQADKRDYLESRQLIS